jgi:hypothetical protein
MLSIPTNARALAELTVSYKAQPNHRNGHRDYVHITCQLLCYNPYQILWYAAARLQGNGITPHYSAAIQEVPPEFQKFRSIHRRIVTRLLFDIISIARGLVENANNSINPVFSYAQY